jgi:hypothetical protein
LATVLLIASALVCGRTRADGPDPATLFDSGLVDMQAHRYATGCPALAESYRLDPHAGGLFTLAECENQWGKIASALADYDTFLDLVAHLPAPDRAKQQERAKIAAERRSALSREIPGLTLSLAADVPAGSTVMLDGKAVPTAGLRSTLPVDPGEHDVVLRGPDGRTTQQHVILARGERKAVTLTPPPPLSGVVPDASDTVAPPTDEKPSPAESGSSRKTAVLVTAIFGAAAVVAGGVTGAIVLAEKASIDKDCPTPTTCASSSDASSANRAKTLGWVSTGTFIGGGALLGAAAILWFTRPKSGSAIEPTLAPTATGGMVGIQGVF